MGVAVILVLIGVGSVVFHFLSPVVVDANCLKLGLHRRHYNHHVLDYRLCLRRDHPVYGLLLVSLPSSARNTGGLRAREQEVGVVADDPNYSWRRRHAHARFVRVEPIHHGSRRCSGVRSRRTAMAVELSLSRKRRRHGHQRRETHKQRKPLRYQSGMIPMVRTMS